MRKHFLVVDDSELNLRVVQALLDKYGIFADYVTSAEQAFEALQKTDYDLALIDYLMPGTNGIEATAIIRKMTKGHDNKYYRNLPIIILTAEDNSDMINTMYRTGANGVLSKPIQPADFLSIVQKWVPTVHGIDEATLMSMLEADSDSYLELATIFCADIPGKHERINEALRNNDYESYTVEVHKIKGEAKVIGATALAEAARILEFTSKALTGVIPNGKSESANIAVIKKQTPQVMETLDTIGRDLEALSEDFLKTGADTAKAEDVSTEDVPVSVHPELEKLDRYVKHAVEALDGNDISLTREWLGEISVILNGLLK